MRHAYRSGAVADAPPAAGASSVGFPADATVPGARWYHAVTSEIVNAIMAAGITPDGADLTQLSAAISARIAVAINAIDLPDAVTLATVNEHLQNNPPDDEAATPAGLRAMLDDLFGSANRRSFTTPGTHSYDWEWGTENGLAVIVPGLTSLNLRDSAKDIDLGTGVWADGAVTDGTTLWFIDRPMAVAYNAATRARDSAKDINLGANRFFRGGMSDGTTIWFIDVTNNRARAYVAATQARDQSKDINLGTGNWADGISDGTTLWFVDTSGAATDFARAYTAATRTRDASKDLDIGNGTWRGGLNDGVTAWFLEDQVGRERAYAYTLSTRNRDADKDFGIPGGVRGGVSDGTTLWLLSDADDMAFAYVFPKVGEATSVEIGGQTYTVQPLTQPRLQVLTGLSEGDTFDIEVGDGAEAGRVDLIPLF